MVRSFLHLEDVRTDIALKELWKGSEYVTNSEEILPVLHDFYSHLYECTDIKSDSEIIQFLDKLDMPSIKMDSSSLTSKITSDEVESAIKKLCLGKAPGIDGLTADFYSHFADQLCDILAVVYNAIFEQGSLTFSQCMVIIILLFKKGDSCLVDNYHPISLTNTDYKILAYILTMHLEPYLSTLIHPNQTAYMSKWFIGLNIRSVQDFMDYIDCNNLDHVILFLDFKKAFDSVSHQFLFHLLKCLGFPQEFICWVWIMYTSTFSVVHHNNWFTPSIPLGCGVWQGCPLSCHLFNLVSQVLIYSLH